MPHDAAQFADSVKQRSTPAETAAANAADVAAARAKYASSEAQSVEDFTELAGLTPPPVTPVITSLVPDWADFGTGDTAVEIRGTGFSATSVVKVDDAVVASTFNAGTGWLEVTFVDPGVEKNDSVYVYNDDEESNWWQFAWATPA